MCTSPTSGGGQLVEGPAPPLPPFHLLLLLSSKKILFMSEKTFSICNCAVTPGAVSVWLLLLPWFLLVF